MTSLPFKFFFLQHTKPSTLVILVSVAKPQRKILQFSRKLWLFLKKDSRVRCDCRVMSRHGTDAVRLLCSDWLIRYFFEFVLFKTNFPLFFFFFNVDTCVVAIVKVSNETIKLIINWTIRWKIYELDQQRLASVALPF